MPLCRFLSMVIGVLLVSVGEMRVVTRLFVVARFVVLRSLMVMASGVFMVFCGFLVVVNERF
ncbi:MAG TPA: hypothetical protein VKZ53_08450 [Candidatus Angelobacter sp.]|nr:hypothetical protein [Candidatus Angelobacter sp.]